MLHTGVDGLPPPPHPHPRPAPFSFSSLVLASPPSLPAGRVRSICSAGLFRLACLETPSPVPLSGPLSLPLTGLCTSAPEFRSQIPRKPHPSGHKPPRVLGNTQPGAHSKSKSRAHTALPRTSILLRAACAQHSSI